MKNVEIEKCPYDDCGSIKTIAVERLKQESNPTSDGNWYCFDCERYFQVEESETDE